MIVTSHQRMIREMSFIEHVLLNENAGKCQVKIILL